MSWTVAFQVSLWSLFLYLLSTSSTADETAAAPYQGCSIIGFQAVSSEAQLVELKKMVGLDFFAGPSMISDSQVMACGEDKDKLQKLLSSYKIKPKTLVEDMGQMARSRDYFADIPLGTMDWNDYHGLENIYTWLDAVVEKYPKLISMEVIGTTYEKRHIRAYKIEKPGRPSSLKATYLECLIHAREWSISLACPYIINELTQHSGNYTRLLDVMRFYIVPVVNPDGFVYTNGTGHSLWRKNRRPIPGAENITCGNRPDLEPLGTDLNRNWPFQWKPSRYPCADDFPGEEGVVEAEIKAVSEFLLSHKDIDTFIDIHCFAQLILLPWGYRADRVQNYKELIQLGRAAADEAERVNGTKFTAIQIQEQFGSNSSASIDAMFNSNSLTAGSSVDWAYGARKLQFSFALELRPDLDEGNSGQYRYPFRVFPREILPVCKEAWTLVQVLASKQYINGNSIGCGAQLAASLYFLAASVCSILLH